MAGNAFLIRDGPVAVPLEYTVPASGELLPLSIRATVDGSSSGQSFYAVVQLIAPSGRNLGNYITTPIAAGVSADITWFPGAELDDDHPSQPVVTGGIESLTSPTGTLAVAEPTGPDTTVDLPASGVTAGTYGDSAHVSQVQVNAEGIVTSASNIAITGVGGGMVNIFDQTLGVSAASIDTGAGGVAAGYSGLMILAVGRAANAVFSGSFNLVFNNDTGANYQYIWTDNSNGTSSSFITTGQVATKIMEGPGSSVGAGIFGVAHVTIPAYTQTTANKAITSLGGFAETGGHSELVHLVGTWNNAAAITRVAFTTGIGNLVAGSRLTIYGLP